MVAIAEADDFTEFVTDWVTAKLFAVAASEVLRID